MKMSNEIPKEHIRGRIKLHQNGTPLEYEINPNYNPIKNGEN
jgi:hypothetical protein